MRQIPLHRDLVHSLVEQISRDHGLVSHAARIGTLPDPPAIGRHEPDVLARGLSETLVIGEAKVGEDLFTETTQEQLHDFTHHVDEQTGEVAALVLAVPGGWRDEAQRALAAADADPERCSIIQVNLPGGPPPPGDS